MNIERAAMFFLGISQVSVLFYHTFFLSAALLKNFQEGWRELKRGDGNMMAI